MKTSLVVLVLALAATLLPASPPHPSVLTVTYKKDKILPVVRVKGNDPYVMVDGKEKLVRIQPRYDFISADDYADNFIECPPGSLEGRLSAEVVGERGNPYTPLDGLFELKATVKAHKTIKRGFITVMMCTNVVFGDIIIHQLPELPADTPTKISLSVRIGFYPGKAYYFAQIFDDAGQEVITTDVDLAWIFFAGHERFLQDNAAFRHIRKFQGQDHAAVPFYTPRIVLDRGVAEPQGEIAVTLSVSDAGMVTSVETALLKDEHLRANVLSTLAGWLYLPELKAGTPVNTQVTVPLKFSVARKYPPSPS